MIIYNIIYIITGLCFGESGQYSTLFPKAYLLSAKTQFNFIICNEYVKIKDFSLLSNLWPHKV